MKVWLWSNVSTCKSFKTFAPQCSPHSFTVGICSSFKVDCFYLKFRSWNTPFTGLFQIISKSHLPSMPRFFPISSPVLLSIPWVWDHLTCIAATNPIMQSLTNSNLLYFLAIISLHRVMTVVMFGCQTSRHTSFSFSPSFLVRSALSVSWEPHSELSVESETWVCLWGPNVMTGVRWHLLDFDGVIPSFSFFQLDFLLNRSQQAKGAP